MTYRPGVAASIPPPERSPHRTPGGRRLSEKMHGRQHFRSRGERGRDRAGGRNQAERAERSEQRRLEDDQQNPGNSQRKSDEAEEEDEPRRRPPAVAAADGAGDRFEEIGGRPKGGVGNGQEMGHGRLLEKQSAPVSEERFPHHGENANLEEGEVGRYAQSDQGQHEARQATRPFRGAVVNFRRRFRSGHERSRRGSVAGARAESRFAFSTPSALPFPLVSRLPRDD